jgi:hypothetical protein
MVFCARVGLITHLALGITRVTTTSYLWALEILDHPLSISYLSFLAVILVSLSFGLS